MPKQDRVKSTLTAKPNDVLDSQHRGMSHSDVHDADDASPRKRLKLSRTATRRKRSTMSDSIAAKATTSRDGEDS